MDKRFMLALGVSSIWGSAESVYALAQQDRLIEDRQHVRIKPSLSAKQAKRDSKGQLKLSINLKGGKNLSSQQSLKSKKLSRKQARAAKKKFSLALNTSKKKGLNALIQTKKKARLAAKQNRKAALRMKQIERKRLQFRKRWERQEAKLQAKKSRVLKRNPLLLNKQKLQEQFSLKQLKTPTLVLQAPDVAKKTVLQKPSVLKAVEVKKTVLPKPSLVKIVAEKKTEEMQTRFKKINDSSEQSVLRKLPLENRISLGRDELNAANEQPNSLPLLSLEEYGYRDAGMHAGAVNNNTEFDEDIYYVPTHSVSKDLTLKEMELTSENLAPVLRELTGKLWDLVDVTSRRVSPTSRYSLDLFEQITTFAGVVNEIIQHLNPSLSHENDLVREGGYDWETLYDDDILSLYPKTQYGTVSIQEEKDLKTNDDLKKNKPFMPLAAEDSDLDMVIHATKMETLENAISQFQYAALQLREKVERDGSDQLEENKKELRRLLNAGYTIEATLPYLKLSDSASTAESVNSLLENHEQSIVSEKLGLSTVLKDLLELEAKSNVSSSLSQPTQADDENKQVGVSELSAAVLPVIQREENGQTGTNVQTGTSALDQKDIEPTDQSSLASKSVATDSDELSTRAFPTLLGSLNELLGELDKVDLKSKNLPANHGVIKLHSSWLKDKLFSIETGGESKSASSIESKEESYDFAADMKDLRSRISHYLTLPLPANDWLLNFKINSGKGNAVQLIKEITELKQELEAPSQEQSSVAAAAQPTTWWWPFGGTERTVTPPPQGANNNASGNNSSNGGNNNDKD